MGKRQKSGKRTKLPEPVQKQAMPTAKPMNKPSLLAYYKTQLNGLRIIKRFPRMINAYVRYFFISPLSSIKNHRNYIVGKESSVWRLLFVLIFAACLIMMPSLSKDYGISWDEKVQRDYGKDIIKYFESGKKDTTIFDMSKHLYFTMLYYGCSFDVLTGVIHQKLLPKADEFALRHAINAIFGVFMMLYVGLVAKQLGGWRVGVLGFLFAWCTPTLFGHSMNNPKDIPFAMWYILSIYYMLRFLQQLPRPRVSDMVGIAIGIGGAISIRVGGLLLIPYLFLFSGIHWLNKARQSFKPSLPLLLPYMLLTSITSLIGYILGLLIWPYGLRNPFQNPLNALKNLSNVNYLHTYENYNGERVYMSDLPWHYVPTQMLYGSPLFVLVGSVAAIALLYFIYKNYKNQFYGLMMMFFMLIFPVFWVVYKHSMVYNGWRHFIFTYLSLVVVAAVGWDILCYRLDTSKYIKILARCVLLVLVLKVCYFMAKEHPNQYIYFNELIGGTKGAYGNFEMDYYSNTVRQAVEWLVKNEPVTRQKIKLCSNNELLTVNYYTDRLADSIQVVWTRDYERQKQDWDYAIFTCRTYSPFQIKNKFFPPKGTIHTIDVDGVPICAIVKRENKEMSVAYSYSSKNKYDEALPHFLAAIEYDPRDEEAYRMAALCYLNLNLPEDALKCLEKSIELNPDNFMAYYLKGYYYMSKNNIEQSEKMYKASIKYRINNGDAHAELGNIYLNNGLYQKALQCYTNAIGFGHSEPGTFANIGITYMNLNSYETAINYFGMALEKNPSFVPAYENLIVCFEKLGDHGTANQIRAKLNQMRTSG